MPVESNREMMLRYLNSGHGDGSMMAEDVVFTIMATGRNTMGVRAWKDVRVPLCVVYDLEDKQIKRGRVHFKMPALLQQLGISMG